MGEEYDGVEAERVGDKVIERFSSFLIYPTRRPFTISTY